MATRSDASSDLIQEDDMDGKAVNLSPSAAESEQERLDRNGAYLTTKLQVPTTQNLVDSPHNSSSQTPTQPAHKRRESIGNSAEATQHQRPPEDASNDVCTHIDTQRAPPSDAPALRVEDDAKDDCYAYVEVAEEPMSNANRQDGLPLRLLFGKRTFALRKSTEAQKRARMAQAAEANGFTDRYDYLKKYPADSPEEGMGPNARAWRVYLDEVEQFDIDMVDNFKDTVDVMLVFAGLFSAVVTAFVAQASSALQVDYTQVAASAALEQLALSRAFYSGSPIPDPSPSTLSLDSSTTTVFDRWVNGLWFTSLSLSLATALFAVLIKQWIQAYVSPVSGTPQERARIRQYRYSGLEKWHVYGIVGLLPTLLHLSLFLFLAGLAVFLLALDDTIATVTTSIAGSVATIYIFSNFAPVFNSQCPYKTPLSTYALSLLYPSLTRLTTATQFARRMLLDPPKAEEILKAWAASVSHAGHSLFRFSRSDSESEGESKLEHEVEDEMEEVINPTPLVQRTTAPSFMKKVELDDISLISDGIDAEALCWVADWSSNPSVRTIVLEAVCDLPLGFKSKHLLRNGGVGRAACASLDACTTLDWGRKRVRPGLEDLHIKSSLVHFQLGWCFFPTLDGVHMNEGTARHVPCIYNPDHAEAPAHHDVDEHVGTYFSLLRDPSWELVSPQHILQSLPPDSPRIVFLHILRRAVLSLRTNSISRSQADTIDWPSCQKLCALVQLEPPPADLFGLWQTTLVAVYLAALVPKIAPVSEDSGLLFKLLFNHIELGSSELLEDLAIKLSVESCVDFLTHTLKNPFASTDFSSSDGGIRLLDNLGQHFCKRRFWVLDLDKVVIEPHHTLLIALLDHSEKHGASISKYSAELRMLIYNLGYILMARNEPQSSDPELDCGHLLERLLRAALILPQLLEPCELLRSQIVCLGAAFRKSPPESYFGLTDIFRVYDGMTVLEKLVQMAGSQLDGLDRAWVLLSLDFYLEQVLPTGEDSPPSPETDITQHGGRSDASSQSHLDYILRHLVQVIRICAACWEDKISRSEIDSYPDTFHTLRLLVKTHHGALPDWNHALAELETLGVPVPSPIMVNKVILDEGPQYIEHNLKEIVFVLRSDLEAARSPGAQTLSQPERPPPPRSFISILEAAGTNRYPGPTLEAIVEEESTYPTAREGSIVSRFTRWFRSLAVLGVVAARHATAGEIIPLHNRPPLEHVQEYGSRHSAEGESLMPHSDEEEGLSANASSSRPT